MTALPLQPPRLLTVAEFAALPETGDVRHELQEGALVMSPVRCRSINGACGGC